MSRKKLQRLAKESMHAAALASRLLPGTVKDMHARMTDMEDKQFIAAASWLERVSLHRPVVAEVVGLAKAKALEKSSGATINVTIEQLNMLTTEQQEAVRRIYLDNLQDVPKELPVS